MTPENREPKPDWNSTERMIPAIVLIGAGALLFLNNMHIVAIHEVLRYWPGIFVALGIMLLVDSRDSGGRVAGGAFVSVGALLLARNLGFIEISLREMWPLGLIGLGIFMLWDRTHWYAGVLQSGAARRHARFLFGWRGYPRESTIFGSAQRNYYGQEFAGGRYETVFGGIEIDLRGSHMEGDEAVIKIDAVMGGAEVRVPEDWLVVIKAAAVFGAVVNKTKAPDPARVPNIKRLIVRGSAVFGGIELKN